jgi:hypothetical protein
MLKVFVFLLLISFITFVVFMLLNRSILTYFPKDHFLRVWWEKHICTTDDLEP